MPMLQPVIVPKVDAKMLAGDFVIAVSLDRAFLPGGHATLSSAVKNCAESKLNIVVLHTGLSRDELAGLGRTVSIASDISGKTTTFLPLELDQRVFNGLPLYSGSHLTYGRLLLAAILPESVRSCVYLDCDTVVNLDVAALPRLMKQDHLVAGVLDGGGPPHEVKSAVQAGLNLSMYINAGVAAYNLKAWRDAQLTERALELGRTHGQHFLFADQSILNRLVDGRVTLVDEKFNTMIAPFGSRIRSDTNGRILHFVCTPKPWQNKGFLFINYKHFSRALRHSPDGKAAEWKAMLTLNNIRTTLRMRWYYKSTAKNLLRSGISKYASPELADTLFRRTKPRAIVASPQSPQNDVAEISPRSQKPDFAKA